MNRNDNSAAIHAIKSAEASLKLARQLLSGATVAPANSKDLSQLSYVEGTFDGVNMVSADGKKYRVNANYATKSMLVYGDKLRAYNESGHYWFKQVDKVRREKVVGVLTKKANVWHVVTADGSYQVSPDAVEFLNLALNDEVEVFLPANNKRVPFATLNFVKKPAKKESADSPAREEERKREEKKALAPAGKAPLAKVEKKEKEKSVKKSGGVSREQGKEEEVDGKKSASAGEKKEKAVKSAPGDSSPDKPEKVVLEEDDLR